MRTLWVTGFVTGIRSDPWELTNSPPMKSPCSLLTKDETDSSSATMAYPSHFIYWI